MKRAITCLPLAVGFLLTGLSTRAQTPEPADSTGLPGDHFSLAGALELFKKEIELEQFEKALNTEANHVNNLDLNGDGKIDFVQVNSHKDGDAVAIVMSVPLGKDDRQDVAVIEIEKLGEDSAVLQIRGDEDLYPTNTIVEPFAEREAPSGDKGPMAPDLVGVRVMVNVWSWRPIPWCFSPRYYPYVSPWYWGHYPGWWSPWAPFPWRAHWGWCHPYRTWYRPWNTCRVVHAHAIYAPRRASSAVVRQRHKDAHERYRTNHPERGTRIAPGKVSDPGKATKPVQTVKPGKTATPKPSNSVKPAKQTKPVQAKPQRPSPNRGTKGGGGKVRSPGGGGKSPR